MHGYPVMQVVQYNVPHPIPHLPPPVYQGTYYLDTLTLLKNSKRNENNYLKGWQAITCVK